MIFGSFWTAVFAASAGLNAADLPMKGPRGLVWEASLAARTDYSEEVAALLDRYESVVERRLRPGERGKVGFKVNTRGGRGLSTPLPLLQAMIGALEKRGFAREDILIVDYSAHNLRSSGIMPPLSKERSEFEGCRVLALDSGQFYEYDWYYDSPLPPLLQQEPLLSPSRVSRSTLQAGSKERKSFLPAPLLFEVDFWFNLAVAVDDPALGVDAALANATLWNVSNSRRFLVNQGTASAAVAEIAAIPELSERMVLHLVSLEAYQFIGGPFFNSIYTRSEPKLWMSSDPVALDRLILERMNTMRRLEGFPEIEPLPMQLAFASSLGLGFYERADIHVKAVCSEHSHAQKDSESRKSPRFEEPPSWLKKVLPW